MQAKTTEKTQELTRTTQVWLKQYAKKIDAAIVRDAQQKEAFRRRIQEAGKRPTMLDRQA